MRSIDQLSVYIGYCRSDTMVRYSIIIILFMIAAVGLPSCKISIILERAGAEKNGKNDILRISHGIAALIAYSPLDNG